MNQEEEEEEEEREKEIRREEKREIEEELAKTLEKARPAPPVNAPARREKDEEGSSNHRSSPSFFPSAKQQFDFPNKTDQGGNESDSEEACDKKSGKHEEVKR